MLEFHLYVITNNTLESVSAVLSRLEQILEGAERGAVAVQIREKKRPDDHILQLADGLRMLTHKHGSPLFISDRLDIALLCGADGIHLGQNSIRPEAVRRAHPHLLIGVSCHGRRELQDAINSGADFITMSPIFDTMKGGSKISGIGTDFLKETVKASPVPIYALGGISLSTIGKLRGIGIKGVAVVSALMEVEDPREATRSLLNAFQK